MKKFCYNHHYFSQNYSTSQNPNDSHISCDIQEESQPTHIDDTEREDAQYSPSREESKMPDTRLRDTHTASSGSQSTPPPAENHDIENELNQPISMRARCMLKYALQHKQMVQEITRHMSHTEEE